MLRRSFKQYANTLKEIYNSKKLDDLNMIDFILNKYTWLKELVCKIGYIEAFKLIEQEKYNITNIKRKAISFQDTGVFKKIGDLLLTYSDISIGTFISSAKAKELLKEVYSNMNIEKAPKGSDLNLYFICKDHKKRVKDKIINGFIVMQNKY